MSIELETLYFYYLGKNKDRVIPEPKYDPMWWLFLYHAPKVRDSSGQTLPREEIYREFIESTLYIEMRDYHEPLQTRDDFLFDSWASRSYENDERNKWYLRFIMMEFHYWRLPKEEEFARYLPCWENPKWNREKNAPSLNSFLENKLF